MRAYRIRGLLKLRDYKMMCCIFSGKKKLKKLQKEIHGLRLELHDFKLQILEALKKPEASQVVFYNLSGDKKERVTRMILKVTQKLPLSVEFQDKFGNAAAVEGAPAWSLTDAALGSLTVAEDGKSAEFVPSGAAGELKVQVTADADLGEGVKSILGELALTLIAGDAVAVAIKAGEAVEA